MKNKKGQSGAATAFGVMVSIVIFAVVVFAVAGFDTVDANKRGVKVKLGEIQGIMEPGMQFTGLFTDVHQYDMRTRKMVVNMNGAEGAVDKDGQAIFATIQINYQMKSDSILDAYSKIGSDKDLADRLNIDGIIREGFKSVTSDYTSLEIFQKRQEIKEKALDKISSNFPDNYFTLTNVIISNIDFNKEFKQAIENRKVAEETAKAESEKVKIAEAQAEIKIAQAEGEKQKAQLEADAKAYQILKQAESEAKALELKREQLTPLMIENNRIDMMREKWDGAYPKWVTGDSMNMLMQMDSAEVGE